MADGVFRFVLVLYTVGTWDWPKKLHKKKILTELAVIMVKKKLWLHMSKLIKYKSMIMVTNNYNIIYDLIHIALHLPSSLHISPSLL